VSDNFSFENKYLIGSYNASNAGMIEKLLDVSSEFLDPNSKDQELGTRNQELGTILSQFQ
jgi:hypothetical protein